MYYPYTAGVAALSHFYFNPLYLKKTVAEIQNQIQFHEKGWLMAGDVFQISVAAV